MTIHPRAIVAPGAKIAATATVGPWAQIGENVVIGPGTKIGSNVIIDGHTTIGAHNEIGHFTTIGMRAQDLHYLGEACPVEIGNNNIIREYSSIHRGTENEVGRQKTIVGDNNYFMVYTHIAHDCKVGSNVTIANHTSLAGHVTIADYVTMSGYVAIHQFCSIGKHAFLGRATKVGQGIIPFVTVAGVPGYPTSLNVVGLKRSGYSLADIKAIKQAYKTLFRQNHKLDDAIALLEQQAAINPVVNDILQFISTSKRSIARPSNHKVEA